MAKTPAFDISRIRNIGIIAHIDAGKTTTTEHLLFYAQSKHRLGGVDQGTTDTDFDPEEQQRGITIYSACVPLTWNNCTINLIDTPGHVDFTAEVERSLRVLDGAVCVFDAQKGVEAQSETVWRQANKYSVPRMVFVNKMDVVGANFDAVVEQVRERLAGNPIPISMPIGEGSQKDSLEPFRGIIDLIGQKALYFDAGDMGKTVRVEAIPADYLDRVAAHREKLFDLLSQHDEKDLLTTRLLEGSEIPIETIRQAIREQTIARVIQPVLCGSGREHIGIQPLLDAITWYLPTPLDRPPVVGLNPRKDNKEEKRRPDLKEPFCGLVFKLISSDHGEIFYIRIYSGTLKANSRVYNPGRDGKEVVGKLFHVFADPGIREDLPEAYAGDIIATMGLKDAVTGDTLCETQHPIVLEEIVFAEAVVSQSIEPDSTADKQKMLDTLNRLNREDPTFLYKQDGETGQMLMSGMGTLHLEVKVHRMERDYRLKVRVGKPRVSYRETISRDRRIEGECIRMAGTTQLYAKLTVEFKNEFRENVPTSVTMKLKPGILPPPLMAAAERGLRGALTSGTLGFPLLNVHATVIGGHFDEVTSSEVAFEAAANDAVLKALEGNVVLLEPVMKVNVNTPSEFVGNVVADLGTRRGSVDHMDSRGPITDVVASVPLARLFDYADRVRSLSQGRAAATMELKAYEPAPEDVLRGFYNPG